MALSFKISKHQEGTFCPELHEYLQLNGFRLVNEDKELNVVTYRRDSDVLLFWKDKIEKRLLGSDKDKVYQMTKAYRGWDGKNMFELMVLLHIMDVIDLAKATPESRKLAPQMSDRFVNELTIHN